MKPLEKFSPEGIQRILTQKDDDESSNYEIDKVLESQRSLFGSKSFLQEISNSKIDNKNSLVQEDVLNLTNCLQDLNISVESSRDKFKVAGDPDYMKFE